MNRIGPRPLGRVEDPRDDQIALGSRPRPDEEGLVRDASVHRATIGFGIHSHRTDPQLAQRPEDPYGDLAAIGYENLREHAYSGMFP
jgi:hypothetical protein